MRKSKNTEGRHAARVGLLLAALHFALPVFTVTVVRGQRASEQPEEPIHLLPPGEIDSARTLRVLDGDTVTEMSFSDYLQGVLRAEMPASFQEDALRAQAVAARTYTYYKMQNGGNLGDTADICTDHTCCQADLSAEQDWICSVTGERCPIFRFPGGSANRYADKAVVSAIKDEMSRRGFVWYDWNADGEDSIHKYISAWEIEQNVFNCAKNKDSIVVLLHDASGHKATVEALPGIIDGFSERGYSFHLLSDMEVPLQYK